MAINGNGILGPDGAKVFIIGAAIGIGLWFLSKSLRETPAMRTVREVPPAEPEEEEEIPAELVEEERPPAAAAPAAAAAAAA